MLNSSLDNIGVKDLSMEEPNKSDKQLECSKTADTAFKDFICPICLKLIQKCVTTISGHSYCESCLDDYLLYKDVSSV